MQNINIKYFHFQALTAFDKDRTGQIKASDFRRVLDNFVFKMTDPQFRHLMSKVQSSTGGMVEYPMFMDYYSHDEQKVGTSCCLALHAGN